MTKSIWQDSHSINVAIELRDPVATEAVALPLLVIAIELAALVYQP